MTISEMTRSEYDWLEVDEQIGRINHKLRGWSNYFCIGTPSERTSRMTAACPPPGASVAEREVQGEWSGEDAIHRRLPPRGAAALPSSVNKAAADSWAKV